MVSIVILSYNTKDLLKKCLESIYRNLNGSFEVIVVDNASTDGSVEAIKKYSSKLKIIENRENYGFTKGNNIGARHANGKYLWFLNSDTMIEPFSLKEIEEFFQGNETVGIIGGLLADQDGRAERSFGTFYTLPHVIKLLYGGFGKDFAEKAFQKNDETQEVDWVSGACMLVARDVFKEVGGWDEKIFMYTEDMEFCYRVRKSGYSVFFLPSLKVIHAGQGSSNRSFAIIQIYKGILYFYKKHKSTAQYNIVKLLLEAKAYSAIFVGVVTRNTYLVETYTKAKKAIL